MSDENMAELEKQFQWHELNRLADKYQALSTTKELLAFLDEVVKTFPPVEPQGNLEHAAVRRLALLLHKPILRIHHDLKKIKVSSLHPVAKNILGYDLPF